MHAQEGSYENPQYRFSIYSNLETKTIEYLLKHVSLYTNVQRDESDNLPFATGSGVLRLKEHK